MARTQNLVLTRYNFRYSGLSSLFNVLDSKCSNLSGEPGRTQDSNLQPVVLNIICK
jgi:hypothetical protein